MSALTDVISDLKTSVEGLSARIDAHKAKDEEIVDALNATIVDLKQTIQDLKNGQTGSEAEITKAVADLTALKNSLDGQMVE
jgi:predicted  nucleic acid-binding Zn-ribbon protein